MREYLVIYEPGTDGWSAYVPDLPGCVSTGPDRAGAEDGIREAIALHRDGLRDDGLPVPPPTTSARRVAAA